MEMDGRVRDHAVFNENRERLLNKRSLKPPSSGC
jgi:hypothetical protein